MLCPYDMRFTLSHMRAIIPRRHPRSFHHNGAYGHPIAALATPVEGLDPQQVAAREERREHYLGLLAEPLRGALRFVAKVNSIALDARAAAAASAPRAGARG